MNIQLRRVQPDDGQPASAGSGGLAGAAAAGAAGGRRGGPDI